MTLLEVVSQMSFHFIQNYFIAHDPPIISWHQPALYVELCCEVLENSGTEKQIVGSTPRMMSRTPLSLISSTALCVRYSESSDFPYHVDLKLHFNEEYNGAALTIVGAICAFRTGTFCALAAPSCTLDIRIWNNETYYSFLFFWQHFYYSFFFLQTS